MRLVKSVARWLAVATLGLTTLASAPAQADSACRSVEVTFKPAGNLQLVAWVETADGRYVDTAYITRLTGVLGLGNRPGLARFKSDFRFPYGRREMVLPVWAHSRNVRYRKVVMGGKFGNSPAKCASGGTSASECDDTTIGYHFSVSSPEPFYCSPRGGITTRQNGVDVVSCASSFYGCKGAYADAPAYSLYPPRADLTSFVDEHDSPESKQYASVNDLVAISGATPPGGQPLATPIRWTPPADLPDGDYVLKVEAHLEGDFNSYHRYPSVDDSRLELNSYGREFLGQPSVIYAVPFKLGEPTYVQTTSAIEGYSDWDGATGTLHPADMTISTTEGSGAGRLLLTSDASGSYRVKVTSLSSCLPGVDGGAPPVCEAPEAPTGLELSPGPSSLGVTFASAEAGARSARFDIRYREQVPIDDSNFLEAIPSSTPPPAPGVQGSTVSTVIGGLRPQTRYYVAVRALSSCDKPSPVVVKAITTDMPKYTTLSGCFIATAAYGSPLASELSLLRRVRDRLLLTNPAGRLLVASYYSLSPPIARALTTDEGLRSGMRKLLAPVVELVRAAGG